MPMFGKRQSSISPSPSPKQRMFGDSEEEQAMACNETKNTLTAAHAESENLQARLINEEERCAAAEKQLQLACAVAAELPYEQLMEDMTQLAQENHKLRELVESQQAAQSTLDAENHKLLEMLESQQATQSTLDANARLQSSSLQASILPLAESPISSSINDDVHSKCQAEIDEKCSTATDSTGAASSASSASAATERRCEDLRLEVADLQAAKQNLQKEMFTAEGLCEGLKTEVACLEESRQVVHEEAHNQIHAHQLNAERCERRCTAAERHCEFLHVENERLKALAESTSADAERRDAGWQSDEAMVLSLQTALRTEEQSFYEALGECQEFQRRLETQCATDAKHRAFDDSDLQHCKRAERQAERQVQELHVELAGLAQEGMSALLEAQGQQEEMRERLLILEEQCQALEVLREQLQSELERQTVRAEVEGEARHEAEDLGEKLRSTLKSEQNCVKALRRTCDELKLELSRMAEARVGPNVSADSTPDYDKDALRVFCLAEEAGRAAAEQRCKELELELAHVAEEADWRCTWLSHQVSQLEIERDSGCVEAERQYDLLNGKIEVQQQRRLAAERRCEELHLEIADALEARETAASVMTYEALRNRCASSELQCKELKLELSRLTEYLGNAQTGLTQLHNCVESEEKQGSQAELRSKASNSNSDALVAHAGQIVTAKSAMRQAPTRPISAPWPFPCFSGVVRLGQLSQPKHNANIK